MSHPHAPVVPDGRVLTTGAREIRRRADPRPAAASAELLANVRTRSASRNYLERRDLRRTPQIVASLLRQGVETIPRTTTVVHR